jgi:hypothetical protein
VFAELDALAPIGIAVIFSRKMRNPPETLAELFYKTDHPTRA